MNENKKTDTETQPRTEREVRFTGKIVGINEGEIRGHLDEMVLKSVEDTLVLGVLGGRQTTVL